MPAVKFLHARKTPSAGMEKDSRPLSAEHFAKTQDQGSLAIRTPEFDCPQNLTYVCC
jgi:hypothetical protein